jgi:hypothetical protein
MALMFNNYTKDNQAKLPSSQWQIISTGSLALVLILSQNQPDDVCSKTQSGAAAKSVQGLQGNQLISRPGSQDESR